MAALIRLVGDFDVAEEAAQEAFAAAVDQWRTTGVPRSPRTWIIQTAKHKAIDRAALSGGAGRRHRLAANPSALRSSPARAAIAHRLAEPCGGRCDGGRTAAGNAHGT
ncbi:MAG TPA: sigma factor [Pirellulales bacterium]|nr:sigma factor [Pirellulales bacterium]